MRLFIRMSRAFIRCVAVVEDSQVDISFRFLRSIIFFSFAVFTADTAMPCHLTGCVVDCWLYVFKVPSACEVCEVCEVK